TDQVRIRLGDRQADPGQVAVGVIGAVHVLALGSVSAVKRQLRLDQLVDRVVRVDLDVVGVRAGATGVRAARRDEPGTVAGAVVFDAGGGVAPGRPVEPLAERDRPVRLVVAGFRALYPAGGDVGLHRDGVAVGVVRETLFVAERVA